MSVLDIGAITGAVEPLGYPCVGTATARGIRALSQQYGEARRIEDRDAQSDRFVIFRSGVVPHDHERRALGHRPGHLAAESLNGLGGTVTRPSLDGAGDDHGEAV